jgi:EAL domain-containing protein (putative c-di-GMP-specific phosphodiesterase class I)
MVPPADFVPIAETTGLIAPLTAWVLERAVRQCAAWADLPEPLTVSVNISAADLRDETLPERLTRLLASHGVAAGRLGVELTETAVIDDPSSAARLLRRLRAAGIAVSLDDFGQGATSLVSLARLSLDEIKIDRSFVSSLDQIGEDHRVIVQSVIDLGHRLGFTVLAEGIESVQTARLLASMGCDEGQGYAFGHPLPPDELMAWLATYDASWLDSGHLTPGPDPASHAPS